MKKTDFQNQLNYGTKDSKVTGEWKRTPNSKKIKGKEFYERVVYKGSGERRGREVHWWVEQGTISQRVRTSPNLGLILGDNKNFVNKFIQKVRTGNSTHAYNKKSVKIWTQIVIEVSGE